jgi:hypothetical protein
MIRLNYIKQDTIVDTLAPEKREKIAENYERTIDTILNEYKDDRTTSKYKRHVIRADRDQFIIYSHISYDNP